MFDDLKSAFKKREQESFKKQVLDSSQTGDESDRKTHIIAVVNQKGGVGKTTTCINLGGGLAKKDFRVLIIDLDPQSNASLGIGINVHHFSSSIYDVLVHNMDLEQVIVPTYLKNLEIAPATSLLTGAQLEIADLLGREGILRTSVWKMLNTGVRHYDYVIIDSSPSLNLLTINGLVAAQTLLVPIQAHYFSLEGMRELFSTVNIVKERINSQLEVLGILPTLVDLRTRTNREVLAQLKEYFKEKSVDFAEYNVQSDVKKREEMFKSSGQMGVPVIDIDGQITVGFDKDRIKRLLDIN